MDDHLANLEQTYNVLIVDDDKMVRDTIKQSVEWNKFGFDMVQEAENGIEGLEQILQCTPDIIFLDIYMPRMNGLEFASIIKRKFPRTRIIIVSGMDKIQYVQQALRIGVNDYVLKPVSKKDICRIVIEQIDAIQNERLQSSRRPAAKEPAVTKEDFVNRLLNAPENSSFSIDEAQSLFPLSAKLPCYYVSFGSDYLSHNTPENEGNAVDFALFNIVDDYLSSNEIGFGFVTAGGEFAALVFCKEDEIRSVLDQVRGRFSKFTDFSISMAVSGAGNLLDIKALRKQAHQAEDQCFMQQNPLFVFYEDIKTSPVEFSYPSALEKRLLSSLFYHSLAECEPDIDAFFQLLIQSCPDAKMSQYALLRLFTKLSQNIEIFNSLKIGETEFDGFDPVDALESCQTVYEAQIWIKQLFSNANEYYTQIRGTRKTTLQKVIQYLNNNYADESLNLKKCSEELYLSYSYITRLLKKEIHKTFVEYLNEIRIEKAKLLLTDNAMTIAEIAEKIGFTNTSYFSTVFKKMTGTPPQQYRQNLGGKRS